MRQGSELFKYEEQVEPFEPRSGDTMYGLPPINMLIEEFLPEGMSTGLVAKYGTGKTWVAFEAMRAVATGTPFLRKFKAREGHVLFVGNDASLLDYANQWEKLTSQYWRDTRPTLDEDEDNPFYEAELAEHPFVHNVKFLIGEPILLEDPDDVARIIATNNAHEVSPTQWVRQSDGEMVEAAEAQYGFDLIIVDTLSKVTHTPESDNTERDRVFTQVRFIQEATGAAILLLHHPPRGSEAGMRGASSQEGSLDNLFILKRRGSRSRLELVPDKVRGVRPESVFFTIQNLDAKNIVHEDGTIERPTVRLVADGIEKAPAPNDAAAEPSTNGHDLPRMADAVFDDRQEHDRDAVVNAIVAHPEFNGARLPRVRRCADDLLSTLVKDQRIRQTRKPSKKGSALYVRT